jgi:nitroreductase
VNVIECLLSRRSIRAFSDRPVEPRQIQTLLEVFFRSPSAADARPWHLVVVEDRARLAALADAMPKCDMLRTAAAGLVVCGDPSLEKIPGFWVQDCAAATENLLIALHGLGLGGVWIGLHPVEAREEAVREQLGLPPGRIPFSLTALGWPAETPAPDTRYDVARLHRDRWGQPFS